MSSLLAFKASKSITKLTGLEGQVSSNLAISCPQAISFNFCLNITCLLYDAETLSSSLEDTKPRPKWALDIALLAH